MTKPVKVLIVEDSEDDARLALRMLQRGGFAPTHRRVQTAADLEAALAGESWDAVISDFNLPGFTGMDALRIFRATGRDIPFILISGTVGEEIAVDALKAGANDYILKMNLPRLASVLERELQEAANRAAHKRGEEALNRFSTAMDATADAIYLVDRASMQFVHVNEAACRMQLRTRAELLSLGPEGVLGTPRAELERIYDALIASGADARPLEMQRKRKDGSQVWVELRRHALRTGDRWTIVTLVRDITGRKAADAKITRLNRVYAVLSGINNAIVRNRERNALFREVCRLAVSEGEFTLARVVELDAQGKARIAASTDIGVPLFQKIVAEYNADPEHCENLLALGLRSGSPLVSNDVASDSRMPNREALTKDGTFAVAVLPIIVERRTAGAVVLRAREAGMFDETELSLLLEVVSNLSFALEHIEQEEKVRRLTRVYAVLSGINSAIVRNQEHDALFREVCRIAVADGGFFLARVIELDTKGKASIAASTESDARPFQQVIDDYNRDPEHSQSLLARCLGGGQPMVSNDVASDPRMFKRATPAEAETYGLALLPIIVEKRVAGAFILRSRETGMFDGAELQLLVEVVSNLSYALAHIEREAKVQRLTRVYAVLSGINALIVRVRDRDELFREACRIAVEHGKFAMSWIGTFDPATQDVTPVAWAGEAAEELTRAKSSARADTPHGTGAVGQSIRARKPIFNNNILTQSFGGPRLKEIIRLGFQSHITLPLFEDQAIVATLTMYTKEQNFFDDEELSLLTGLAGDISFAISNLAKQERLDYLAYYDELTGLANRALFLERVAQYIRGAVSGGHKLAVFFVDLERFRNINDSLGRPAGDALLKQVSEWLSATVGDANLLARLGTDHFAVVLPELKQAGNVAGLLDKLARKFLDHSFQLNDTEFRIAAKIGAALFPKDGTDAETLLRNAEAALKKAKARGDRYLFYKSKMNELAAGKLSLETQLRQALDKGEFVLHYQPKINLESGKLTGAEALIRWNDPRTGLVPPGRFIPALEETGLILDVGRWALRQAIHDHLRWRAEGLPAPRIAVNVSPLQLRSPGFIVEIEQVLGVDALAAAGLELEITESLIMEDVKHNIASLKAIRAMGVTIAIDDFGTGFSSLSYLAKLPVDTLKIDRSFVIEMTAEAQGLSLVSTIINLAHALKLKVVAEGVETEEQSRLLRLLRCDEMQGFLFSKPLPAQLFETRLLAPAELVSL